MKNSTLTNSTLRKLIIAIVAMASFTYTLAQSSLPLTSENKSYSQLVSIEEGYSTCPISIPKNHFVLAESFFENFDYVVRRIAYLEAHGFENVNYLHSNCQNSDLEKSLFIILISKPTLLKKELYKEMFKLYKKAKEEDVKLITTRIIHYE